jgi:hypothetical protein
VCQQVIHYHQVCKQENLSTAKFNVADPSRCQVGEPPPINVVPKFSTANKPAAVPT